MKDGEDGGQVNQEEESPHTIRQVLAERRREKRERERERERESECRCRPLTHLRPVLQPAIPFKRDGTIQNDTFKPEHLTHPSIHPSIYSNKVVVIEQKLLEMSRPSSDDCLAWFFDLISSHRWPLIRRTQFL